MAVSAVSSVSATLNSVNPAGFIRRSGGAAPIFVKSGHAHRVGGDPYGLVPAAFLRQQQTGAPEPTRPIAVSAMTIAVSQTGALP